MELEKVSAITIPEGSVDHIDCNGVRLWPPVFDPYNIYVTGGVWSAEDTNPYSPYYGQIYGEGVSFFIDGTEYGVNWSSYPYTYYTSKVAVKRNKTIDMQFEGRTQDAGAYMNWKIYMNNTALSNRDVAKLSGFVKDHYYHTIKDKIVAIGAIAVNTGKVKVEITPAGKTQRIVVDDTGKSVATTDVATFDYGKTWTIDPASGYSSSYSRAVYLNGTKVSSSTYKLVNDSYDLIKIRYALVGSTYTAYIYTYKLGE